MQTKALNPQVFLECLCLSVFGGMMLYLAHSGKYLSYVTPRMKPYLYFTAIVMLIWACAELPGLLRPQHKIRSAHCFVLVIPLLFLVLPHTSLSSADLARNYSDGGPFVQNTVPSQPAPNMSGQTNTGSPGALPGTDDSESGLSGLDTVNRRIMVSNDQFYPWIAEIYTNLDQYTGYTVSVTGFVFKDSPYIAENQFVPARLAMTCCTADLTPVGMLCIYDKAPGLQSDSWVTVEGVIVKGEYEGEAEPHITVTKVTPAQKVEGYIYPYS